jgi:hypothetical protein
VDVRLDQRSFARAAHDAVIERPGEKSREDGYDVEAHDGAPVSGKHSELGSIWKKLKSVLICRLPWRFELCQANWRGTIILLL